MDRSPVSQLNHQTGVPHFAHSLSRNLCFHDHHLRRIPDQYRFCYRVQRHHLPRCCVAPELLLHHHCLPSLETFERQTVTGTAVVAWEIRFSDQHCIANLPYPHLFLCVLACGDPGAPRYDELGGGYVRRYGDLIAGVLCYTGEAYIRWTGHDGQAGPVDEEIH